MCSLIASCFHRTIIQFLIIIQLQPMLLPFFFSFKKAQRGHQGTRAERGRDLGLVSSLKVYSVLNNTREPLDTGASILAHLPHSPP